MSRLSVKYFMWAYQPHFQSIAESRTQELFDHLLPALDTSLFLVGVKVSEREDRLPICVEPDHYDVQPSAFVALDSELQNVLDNDERSKMMYSDAEAAKRVHARLQLQSLARAIERCCNSGSGQEHRLFLASDPIRVEDYMVSCVLDFDRDAYESQLVFDDDTVDRMPVERSLIQAIAREFLDSCRDGLREDEPGVDPGAVKANTEELLRRGGKRFVSSVAWRAFSLDGLATVQGLYDAMNAISAMHYEGSIAIGRLILAGRGRSGGAGNGIRFVESVSLRDSRRIRKLLELTHGRTSLLVAENGIIGLTDASTAQHDLSVDIRGHRHWRVLCRDRVVCEIRYGVPSLPSSRLEEWVFRDLCSRIFPKEVNTTYLWRAASSCVGQKHGTTMVISDRAEAESDRLSQRSTLIEPRELTEWEIQAVSSIDGAILFSHSGICHAIGVILDGLATEKGDPARGARYNSAVRYLSMHGDGCLILIVSEDGDITLLPQLPARIFRQRVEDAVSTLMHVAEEVPFRHRVYAESLNVLDSLRFYLSKSQCEQLNSIVGRVENRLDEEGRNVRISRREFTPSKEMNDSYWLKEENLSESRMSDK
ncbi:MAG: diadenylate cyclase [Thermoguttaceae bacterium]